MLALGLDGFPRGWVVAVVDGDHLRDVAALPSLASALERWPGADAVAIDIPMGLPEGAEPRPADVETRALLGPRASSLFMTPPLEVISAPSHAEAIRIARDLGCPAPSAQAFALRSKILEVAPIAASDARIIEVHPELAFRMLNGAPLSARKRSWNGLQQRLRLLERNGVVLPGHFEGGGHPAPDDVVDAAVCALVATRYASGLAASVPTAHTPPSRLHSIWYAKP